MAKHSQQNADCWVPGARIFLQRLPCQRLLAIKKSLRWIPISKSTIQFVAKPDRRPRTFSTSPLLPAIEETLVRNPKAEFEEGSDPWWRNGDFSNLVWGIQIDQSGKWNQLIGLRHIRYWLMMVVIHSQCMFRPQIGTGSNCRQFLGT